jgi:hypothetical protein
MGVCTEPTMMQLARMFWVAYTATECVKPWSLGRRIRNGASAAHQAPPCSLICLASFSARSALGLTSTTLAPSRAKMMAVAMPLPTPSPRGACHDRDLACKPSGHFSPISWCYLKRGA